MATAHLSVLNAHLVYEKHFRGPLAYGISCVRSRLHLIASFIDLSAAFDTIDQGSSKFTFIGPNLNYHQRQKVRNNCYYKTSFL